MALLLGKALLEGTFTMPLSSAIQKLVENKHLAQEQAENLTEAARDALQKDTHAPRLLVEGKLTPEHIAAIKTDPARYALQAPGLIDLINRGVDS